jgi:hypothetical protein
VAKLEHIIHLCAMSGQRGMEDAFIFGGDTPSPRLLLKIAACSVKTCPVGGLSPVQGTIGRSGRVRPEIRIRPGRRELACPSRLCYYDNFPDTNWSQVSTLPFHFHNGDQNVVAAPPFALTLEQGFREFMAFVQRAMSI